MRANIHTATKIRLNRTQKRTVASDAEAARLAEGISVIWYISAFMYRHKMMGRVHNPSETRVICIIAAISVLIWPIAHECTLRLLLIAEY